MSVGDELALETSSQESFDQTFSKVCESRAELSSPTAVGETPYSLSFCELFLWAYCFQRKSG